MIRLLGIWRRDWFLLFVIFWFYSFIYIFFLDLFRASQLLSFWLLELLVGDYRLIDWFPLWEESILVLLFSIKIDLFVSLRSWLRITPLCYLFILACLWVVSSFWIPALLLDLLQFWLLPFLELDVFVVGISRNSCLWSSVFIRFFFFFSGVGFRVSLALWWLWRFACFWLIFVGLVIEWLFGKLIVDIWGIRLEFIVWFLSHWPCLLGINYTFSLFGRNTCIQDFADFIGLCWDYLFRHFESFDLIVGS